jgi:hypothetical protein
MSIVSHLWTTAPQSDTRMTARIVFLDHVGLATVISQLLPIGTDVDAVALSMYADIEEQQADGEVANAYGVIERGVNPDKAAVYQSQADFDRRLLGRLMTEENVQYFYAGLPFWQAVEGRGGANANQRASYLGVVRAEYDLVADRFGDVQGIGFFLDDAKGQIWPEPLEEWL